MKSIKKQFLSFVLITILTVMTLQPGAFMLPAYADSGDGIESYITEIYSDEKKKNNADSIQELLDGAYSDGAGGTSDWFVYALMRYKGSSYDYTSYIKALEKHINRENSDSATSREKFALILGAEGKDQSYIKEVMDEDIGALGIMSNVFGLHLLNNGFISSSHTTDSVIAAILSAQNEDGGWALSGTSSDVDVTAMVIQALAPHTNDSSVKKAAGNAVSLLSSRQLSNGGFKSYGKENPESAAQVIAALTSLGKNPLTDKDFIKNGNTAVDFMLTFRASDYGYSHTPGGEYNATATSQVAYSLISIKLLEKDKLFYVYRGVTADKAAVTAEAEQTAVQTAAEEDTEEALSTVAESTKSKHRVTTTRYSRTTKSYWWKNSTTAKSGETTSEGKAGTDAETETVTEAETETTKLSILKRIFSRKDDDETTVTSAEDGTLSGDTEKTVSVTEGGTLPSEETKATAKAAETENAGKGLSPKVYIISGIWVFAVIAAVILLVKKNKKIVNYIVIAAVGGVLTAVIAVSNIESPAEFYKVSEPESDDTIAVTISITCDTVAGKGDEAVTPSDGVILPETEITLDNGATVYDCLIKAAKLNKIQLEDNTQTLTDHSGAYISGINNLYEFDYGDLSGWMYSVDGDFADVGCGEYTLSGGEEINWEYTCNLGDDLK